MSVYYTAIIFLSIFAVLIIQISIFTSGTLTKDKKRIFHLLFSMIALGAFCEWLGVLLQSTGPSTRIFHIVIKAIELSVAPSIGVLIAWVLEIRAQKLAAIGLTVNMFLEFLSGIFGFIYSVDSNSNYTHAKFYFIYIIAYVLSMIYFIYIASKNIKRYQYNGISYFAMVVLFMIAGIIVQLIFSEMKIVYVVLAIASVMMYVFTLEMIMQTDKLTELINRRGYENYISHLDSECVVLFFDVDRFKDANDMYGHSFGDMCLSKIGTAIKNTYARFGKCFRYGGDEFCVILTKNFNGVEELNKKFVAEIKKLKQKDSRIPDVTIGYAFFNPENGTVLQTIEEADKMMYLHKEKRRNSAQ
ncbi:MAG: GGDEF domain-containing protein [Clostridia bacterium]|nr:GGDEF domain-containing protein [Clostridia bacterium]